MFDFPLILLLYNNTAVIIIQNKIATNFGIVYQISRFMSLPYEAVQTLLHTAFGINVHSEKVT